MLITQALFIAYEVLSRRVDETVADEPEDDVDAGGPVIIAGIGRFGQIVNRMMCNSGFETIVLDNDLNMIQIMRKMGFKGFFGDPTRPEILHAAGLHEASILVVTINDLEAAERLVHYARSEWLDLHIVARARDRLHVYRLFRAGANDIVREMFDSSLRAGRYVLEKSVLANTKRMKPKKHAINMIAMRCANWPHFGILISRLMRTQHMLHGPKSFSRRWNLRC